MEIKPGIVQFTKFVVVGIINTAIDWIVFFLLKLLPFFLANRPIAKAISFVFAAVNSFFINSFWTFKKEFKSGLADSQGQKISTGSVYFGRFFSVSLIGWLMNTLTYTVTINLLPPSFSIRNADIIALIFASGAGIIWNFFANKFWTYKKIKTDNVSFEEKRKRRMFNMLGVLLLGIMAIVSLMVMRGDSAIVDEVAHIPAGYSYDKYHDYRLNPEHPPLAKAIAGFPLTFIKLNELNQSPAWKGINQWESGWDFIYRLGNNADQILFWSRLPMILLLLILGIYLYRFASELFGRKVAVVVLTMFAFYPEFLAHGHLVTTDVAATLGFVLAIYYFYHWTQNRTLKNLIFAGLAFGIAQLLKFSAVLLIPVFFVYICYLSYLKREESSGHIFASFWPLLKDLLMIGVIGLILIWLVYIPLTWNTPAGIEHQLIETNLTADARTLVFRNFLHLFENSPILRAIGHYILGIFLVFGRVGGGNSTYILGHFSDKSISWFFPLAWLLKTPLSIIILTFSSLILLLINRKRGQNPWVNVLILTPIIIYWLITLKGSLNIGIRHLMPTVPFVLLFIGSQIKPYILNDSKYPKIIVGALLGWLIISVGLNYPKYMSYFNELTIGKQRYNVMVDSSLDWGQDLLRLKSYVEKNKIDDLKIDYFGGGATEYYLPNSKAWRSGYGPTTGHLAISATFYQFSRMYGEKEGKWSYQWLESFKPEAIIGDSILLFNITPEDLNNHPATSPYAITSYDTPEGTLSPTPAVNN